MQMYNDPDGGTPSSIGSQPVTEYLDRAAIIAVKEDMVFGQLSDTMYAPKHHGNKIKRTGYIHILDERNLNHEGIDAVGNRMTPDMWYVMDFSEVVANLNGYVSEAQAKAAALEGQTVRKGAGYLYHNSRDVGSVQNGLPSLGEHSKDVNRVGMTRIEQEGSFYKYGFHQKYTQDDLDFDSDPQLLMHIHKEMLYAANLMNEDQIQLDLLNSPGVIRYGGAALSKAQMTGEGIPSLITYQDLIRMSISMTDNHCPMGTRIVTGTRLTDTKTVPAARPLMISSELIPMVMDMVDNFGDRAYVPWEKYAAGTTQVKGEIGRVGPWIIVVVPRMMKYEGAGADVGSNPGYRETDGKYDVHPMLSVGTGCFTQIGFHSSNSKGKFKVKYSAPESPESYAQDVFGESGFMSIKWWYGLIVWRPEWLGVCYTIAKW